MRRTRTIFVIISMIACCANYTATSQMLVRVAGNGTCGHTGDGGPARTAELCGPWGVGADSAGNIYFGDWYGYTMRRISTSGIITKFAGDGLDLLPGTDGTKADTTSVGGVWALTFDRKGNLYFNEERKWIRKIATDGTISTVAGNSVNGYMGDGYPATANGIFANGNMAIDKQGNIYVPDFLGLAGVIRKISPAGIMTTFAGNGTDSTDGVAATAAAMFPLCVALDDSGNLFFTDLGYAGSRRSRIRKIDKNGIITTFLGQGTDTTNGISAANTYYSAPYLADLAVSPSGELFYAEQYKIRKVSKSGIVSTVVGTGTPGFTGDSVLAAIAQVNEVNNIGFDSKGNLYFADEINERIWKVVLTPEAVTTLPETPSMTVSPNPGQGIFDLSLEGRSNASVVVYNAFGQVVFQSLISNGHAQIDISSRPAGVYFARVADEYGAPVKTEQIIKM